MLDTDTKYKAVAFIETYTGRAFWPLHPAMEALSVIDIAHALSNQCRYSGHVKFFYSVAQHCVLLAQWLEANGGSPLECLQILMHDAPEAYLVDIPRPVKQYMPEYRVWDHAINDVIREWMGWSDLPIMPIQDELDSRVILDERAALMSNSGLDWGHNIKPLGVDIYRMLPRQAEWEFLQLYAKYSEAIEGKVMYLSDGLRLFATSGRPLHLTTDLEIDQRLFHEIDVRGGVAKTVHNGEPSWHHGKFELRKAVAA